MMRAEAVHFEKERGVTEVLVVGGIAHATVTVPLETVAESRLDVLLRLAAANIPVFLIKLLPTGVSFALREGVVDAGKKLLTDANLPYVLRPELSLVTIVAGAMRDLSGVMAAIYETLTTEQIAVRQTGDAHNAVHCLVASADAERAASALRRTFGIVEKAELVRTLDKTFDGEASP